jgi:hypothetical protein
MSRSSQETQRSFLYAAASHIHISNRTRLEVFREPDKISLFYGEASVVVVRRL